MDAYSNYLIVDPITFYGVPTKMVDGGEVPVSVITDNQKLELIEEARKRYRSMYHSDPPQEPFWCFGYEVACAGPIPERTK